MAQPAPEEPVAHLEGRAEGFHGRCHGRQEQSAGPRAEVKARIGALQEQIHG